MTPSTVSQPRWTAAEAAPWRASQRSSRRQAVDDRLQHRRRQHHAEQRDEQGAARVVDAEFAHAPEAVGADQRRQRVQPAPDVARAVQIEAVQAEAAADQRQPGRDASRDRGRPPERAGGVKPAPWRRPARGPLHQDDVEPAVELPARGLDACRCGRSRAPGARRSSRRSAESPITASIWRAPAASQRASSSASSRRPKPRPALSAAR